MTDLHAVQQGRGNGVQHIRGAHEQHFGEVDGHVQVVVHKSRVLFRVQQLQQGACRVPLISWAADTGASRRGEEPCRNAGCLHNSVADMFR